LAFEWHFRSLEITIISIIIIIPGVVDLFIDVNDKIMQLSIYVHVVLISTVKPMQISLHKTWINKKKKADHDVNKGLQLTLSPAKVSTV